MKDKYIRHSIHGFILWQGDINSPTHKFMSDYIIKKSGGHTISAGFVYWDSGIPACCGFSQSLNKESHRDDTGLLCERYGIKYENQKLKI